MLSELLQSTVGDFLYYIGFQVEYTLVRLAQLLTAATRWLLRTLGGLLVLALRPAALALPGLRRTLRSPRRLAGLLLPLLAAAGTAALVRTVLDLPYVLRVEANGQVVGYVASETVFDNARADVPARASASPRSRSARPGNCWPPPDGSWTGTSSPATR